MSTSRPRVVVVDYGMGNRRSVEKALLHVGADAVVSSSAREIAGADGLVVPGVGAFPRAMANLQRLGLDEVLRERHGAGVPMLGICLGMQVAFDGSDELGGASGLGLIAGGVDALDAGESRKLPHIGWNEVRWERSSPYADGLPAPCALYHVHSFVVRPADAAVVLATADYGERFVTAVTSGSFLGVQFHPEKSSVHGLRLLENWLRVSFGGRLEGGGDVSATFVGPPQVLSS
jgi:glutamine amidotransferase